MASYAKSAAQQLKNISAQQLRSMNREQVEELVKRAGGIVNRRLPALERAEERYGHSVTLQKLKDSGRAKIDTNTQGKTYNQLQSEAAAALNFLRDPSNTGSPAALKATFKASVFTVMGFNQMTDEQIETAMRQYLKRHGITRVSKRDLTGRFLKQVPKNFVTDIYSILRSIEEKYGRIPSEVRDTLMASYTLATMEHGYGSLDPWDADDFSAYIHKLADDLMAKYSAAQYRQSFQWGPTI